MPARRPAPDANMEQAAKDILGAAYGSAGERCMALPVVVPVGEGTAEKFLKAFMPKLDAMTVGTSTDPDADYGPVVTQLHKESIDANVDKAVAEGTYQDEIFGPVLQIVRAKNFEEALALPTEHQYGNGVAIFTQNGRVAREFADRVEVGMVGINVPIPVPVAYHSFGGWKRSAFGDDQYGMEGLRFYTKVKTVTERWPEGETEDSAFIIPHF